MRLYCVIQCVGCNNIQATSSEKRFKCFRCRKGATLKNCIVMKRNLTGDEACAYVQAISAKAHNQPYNPKALRRI
jgi:hypothetical protein